MTDLTEVHLTFLRKQTENYIRFGNVEHTRILDRACRIVAFAPGSVFLFVRWSANAYGTILSRADILRAVASGAACTTVAGVHPGAEILLAANGWPNVERLLFLVDAIEARGIRCADASPDYWRHVHNRFRTRLEPRIYNVEQHRAWLMRQKVMA